MIDLSNLVLSSILMRMGSSSGAAPAYPHHSIRSNSCTIRATVYSICKWPNTRPKQIRGPMLNGRYCVDVGLQFSHRDGFHVSTSAKPITASRRCELITAYAARTCQCLFLVFRLWRYLPTCSPFSTPIGCWPSAPPPVGKQVSALTSRMLTPTMCVSHPLKILVRGLSVTHTWMIETQGLCDGVLQSRQILQRILVGMLIKPNPTIISE